MPSDDYITNPDLGQPQTTDQIASRSRLLDALEEYYVARDSGQSFDRDAFLARYAEFGAELASCLEGLQFLENVAPQVNDHAARGTETVSGLQALASLGDFRLLREIGRGGMGVVYEAEQQSLGRRVAVKVLPFAAVLDNRQLQRFKNEAQAAASLQHQNIVPVYSVGCDRGVHYYSMQFVEGKTIAQLIEEWKGSGPRIGFEEPQPASPQAETGPMGALSTNAASSPRRHFETVARLGVQVAGALQFAHSRGIVHRDVKPSNLMVDSEGTTWVTDFGLASTQSDSNLTVSGNLLGTLRYMSPEQASGRAVLLDHRTDIYSLGATLYELLALQPAFPGTDRRDLLRRITDEEPPRPRKIDQAIPADLETVVLKAMSKDAEARYQSADELAADLSRFLEHRPIRARRTGQVELLRRWAKRNPLAASLITLVFVLLTTLATVASWNAVNVARTNETIQQRLYAADVNRAQSTLEQGDYVAVERILLRHVPGSGKINHRAFEWYYLWDQCHRDVPEHTLDHGLNVYGIAYSPDGHTLASTSWRGTVHYWDTATGRELTKFRAHRSWATIVRFTAAGDEMLTGGHDGKLNRWSSATQKLLQSIEVSKSGEAINEIALGPDEELVAVGIGSVGMPYPTTLPSRVSVWNRSSEHKVFEFDGMTGATKLAFSRDGKLLVAGAYDGQLRVWQTDGWQLLKPIQAHGACVRDLTFSPDGTLLATCGGIWNDGFVAGEIKLWDTADWHPIRTIHKHSQEILCVAFAPDGDRLAACSRDGQMSLHNLKSGRCVASFTAHSAAILDIEFSPDGYHISSSSYDNSVRIWPTEAALQPAPNPVLYRGHVKRITQVTVCNNGESACSTDNDGTVHVWDTTTGQSHYILGPYGGSQTYATVTSDNRYLAVASGSHGPILPAKLHLYEFTSAKPTEPIWTAELTTGFVRGLEFSPDGSRLAVGAATQLVLFESPSGQVVSRSNSVEKTIKCVRYSMDGSQLAFTTEGGETVICDGISGEIRKRLRTDQGGTMAVAFFPDGGRFVTVGSDGVVRVWDARTCELFTEDVVELPDWLFDVDVSPDGQRVVAACKNGSLYVCDPRIGESVLKLTLDPTSWGWNCRFTPDGSVAAGTFDARIWHAPNIDKLKFLSVASLLKTCRPQ